MSTWPLRIGALPDSNLVATQVGAIRRVVCASPDYLRRFGTPQSLADLATHRCISFEGLDAARRMDLRRYRWREAPGAPSSSRLTVSTADAAIAAAELRARPDARAVVPGRRRAARGAARSRARQRGTTRRSGQPGLPGTRPVADEDSSLHRLCCSSYPRTTAVVRFTCSSRSRRAPFTDCYPATARSRWP